MFSNTVLLFLSMALEFKIVKLKKKRLYEQDQSKYDNAIPWNILQQLKITREGVHAYVVRFSKYHTISLMCNYIHITKY